MYVVSGLFVCGYDVVFVEYMFVLVVMMIDIVGEIGVLFDYFVVDCDGFGIVGWLIYLSGYLVGGYLMVMYCVYLVVVLVFVISLFVDFELIVLCCLNDKL